MARCSGIMLIAGLVALSACRPAPAASATLPVGPADWTSLPPTVTATPAALTATQPAPSGPAPTAHPFAGDPAWIAYQTNRGGGESLWLVHPDGSDNHQIITDHPGEELLPNWSPDGAYLTLATRGGETEALYEYALATGELRQLFACVDPCLGDDEPSYSPDGTQVAFSRYLGPLVDSPEYHARVPSECSLWIGDRLTGAVTQITHNPGTGCDREYLPRWSPDGTQLVYTRDAYANGAPLGTAVYLLNADGSGERQVTPPNLIAGEADWSPDGAWIVFATYPLFEYGEAPLGSELYRIHPDGTGQERLTGYSSAELRATQPRYSPDGQWIVFTAVTPNGRSLWGIPAEGGEAIVIAPGGVRTHGTWQP